jgi:hypothetical protein
MDAANDLLEGERKRREKEPEKPRGLSFNRRGFDYGIDKSSGISARVSLGLEDGKPKVRSARIEYRKEF